LDLNSKKKGSSEYIVQSVYYTDYRLGHRDILVQFLAGRRNYALVENIQIGFGAHPVFYSFGSAGSFSRDKAVRARN